MKTLSREEAEPLIKAGKIRPAYLYETGKKVFVQLSPTLKRVYVYVKPQ